MTVQDGFMVVVVIYAVANLASMGLELDLRSTIQALRNPRLVLPALGFAWIAGPALAIVISRLIPLPEPYVVGLMIFSLAPTAPLLPMVVRRAHGDINFAAVLLPVAMVSTVVMMPLLAPLLIEGLTVSALAIAKPLVLTVLLPLVVGVVIRLYAGSVADWLLPVAKRAAGIATLLLLVFTLVFYSQEFIDALGSYAILVQVLFILAMALLAFVAGFGATKEQRRTMSLGMSTRNGSAMFAALLAFPEQDPLLLVFLLLTIPVVGFLAFFVAHILSPRADKTAPGAPT